MTLKAQYKMQPVYKSRFIVFVNWTFYGDDDDATGHPPTEKDCHF